MIFFLRIASESEKVFVRIFDDFLGVQVSQKQVFFRWTMILTPPPVF